MLRGLAITLPLAVLVATGCGPADGKSCDKDKDSVICLDSHTRLSCEGETWRAESCLGPNGCDAGELFVSCDSSLATEDSACGTTDTDNVSCTLDKKSMLRCKRGKWEVASRCLGPKGCEPAGIFVACDTSIVIEGDTCDAGGTKEPRVSYGCSADKKTMLACKDERWKKVERCLGAEGCYPGVGVKCDGPTASPGDFCIKGARDNYACSPDKRSELRCEVSGWTIQRACHGPQGCSSSALGVSCDDSVP